MQRLAGNIDLDHALALAVALADAAGAAIRPHFRQPIQVDEKPDLSPVTVADRAAVWTTYGPPTSSSAANALTAASRQTPNVNGFIRFPLL